MAGHKKLTEYPEVLELAQKYNATPAQVLIAWGVKRGYSVIPKSVTPGTSVVPTPLNLPSIRARSGANMCVCGTERIVSNFQQIELSDEDFEKLTELGRKNPKRFNVKTTYPPYWDINIFNDELEKTTTNQVKIA